MQQYRSFLSPLLLPLTLLVFVGCQQAYMNTAEDRQAIDAIRMQYADAFNNGDAMAVSGLFTEGGQILPPNGPMVMGSQARQEFLNAAIESGATGVMLTSTGMQLQGDLAYDMGMYQITIQPEMGEAMTDMGKYVTLCTRENGEWKIAANIWNSDIPLPEPEMDEEDEEDEEEEEEEDDEEDDQG